MQSWKQKLKGDFTTVIFVQETHVTTDDERRQLQRDWMRVHGCTGDGEGHSFWSIGTERAKGVGILLNPRQVNAFRPLFASDWTDRTLCVTNGEMTLLNVYGPHTASA